MDLNERYTLIVGYSKYGDDSDITAEVFQLESKFKTLGWISVEERMPTEDALYLIHAPSLDPEKPFIHTSWFNPDNDMEWELIPSPWADAVTHWMLLPKPPIIVDGVCAGCGLPLDGDHAPWCRTLEENK